VLTPTDLETMRNFGLQLATDLQGKDGVAIQASGARVEAEVRRFWAAMDVPSATSTTH
jgi:hypothetical protein